jgi:3-keto-5-aminohexanoate cleavage enzyme
MADPQPVIVTVAPTGPLTTREQHPGVPLTPAEIGVAVAEAAEAGAAVAHIHARDDRGVPTADPDVYREIIGEIESRCGAIWQAIGIGRAQLPLTFAALALGGNVRVGLEDNVYWSRGQLADSNAQLVGRAVELVRLSGRPLATPADVRAQLAGAVAAS